MSLFNVFRRRAHQREMTDEMRFHIDMEAAELEKMGVPRDEARRRALASFGGVQRFTEEGFESRGGTWLEDLMRDTRYGIRSLLRSPGYTAVVVGTLALGIAANTSIFSVANGILFRRLPYRAPEKLMVLWDDLSVIGVPEAWVTGPEVARLRADTKSFEGFSVVRVGSANIGASDGSEPIQVPRAQVSANFFQILGSGPVTGRGFTVGEDRPGAAPVAVITNRLWTQRFGADKSIVGRDMILDGQPTTIVGILPPTFRYSQQSSLGNAAGDADVYLTYPDTVERMVSGNHSLGVLARVRSDASQAAALADLARVGKSLDAEIYGGKGSFKFVPVMLQERIVREVRPALMALLAAVGVLMLIMCANLAVLSLVRAARRDREMTVRRAIGASHGRVSRQILTETVLLSLAGAVLGTLLGTWALKALLALAPPGLPRRDEIGIDLIVLGVTLGLALIVGIGMGLAPVFQSVRSDIASVLREKAPSHAGGKVRRSLVLAQLSLSMVLLAGTGLLLGSFVRLMHVDPGFNAEGVLTIELMASRAKYQGGQPVADVMKRYVDAVRGIPGVVAAGASMAPPLSAGTNQSGGMFPGSPMNTGDRQKDRVLVDNGATTPGFFAAMGIPILEGKDFDASMHDSATSRVAIIDELLAKRYFPKQSAIGQIVTIDGDSLRIVGVARHFRMYNLEDVGREQVWQPHTYAQFRYMIITARIRCGDASCDPMSIAPAAREAVHSVDKDQPIIRMVRMTDTVRDSLSQRRLVLTLVGMFAAVALLLAALGVYGVTASSVSQRTREFGIRMALGADRGSVIWSVLSEPTRLVALGLGLGLVATYAAGRVVERLLYGIRPTDPLTIAAVALVLLIVAVLASYLPARRATRVDPMVALRSD